jgi:lipopolysaccharide export system permease protein
MRLLDRYIFREVSTTWLAVTLVLLFILVTNQFARVLGKAAGGDLPKDAVFALLGLTSVQYVSVLIPVALLMAVMLALGRLSRDSELTAITACGVGNWRLLRPLFVLATLLALLLGWLTLVVVPRSYLVAEQIQAEAARFIDSGGIEPGRFHNDEELGLVFFVERVGERGLLQNLFMQRRQDDRVEVAVARSGRIVEQQDGGDRTLILYDGQRYEGVPGTVDFQVVKFAEHGIPIRPRDGKALKDDPKLKPTPELLGATGPRSIAELQWRISVPLSLFGLTMIAVPLSRTGPREGRYGRLAAAILVYVLYTNLTEATRSWVERGLLPPSIGLWWVHGALIAAALLALWLQERPRRRPKAAGA